MRVGRDGNNNQRRKAFVKSGGIYRRYGKRAFDVLLSGIGLVLAAPLLVLTAVLLAIFQKGQVFFVQERPGLHGKIFRIYKFKTMTDERDAEGNLLPDEARKTPIGRLVRRLSIDELLQLLNVLRGEMSLIGPRPLLVEYLSYYSDYQMRRHEVRPGITGLAQVKGRNALSWERRFRYDVFYVDHLSFRFDLAILGWTLKKLLNPQGSDIDSPTAGDPRFRGTPSRVK